MKRRMKIKVLLVVSLWIPGIAFAEVSAKDLVESCKAYVGHTGSLENWVNASTCRYYVEGNLRGRGYTGPVKPIAEAITKQSSDGSATDIIDKVLSENGR